MSGGGGDSSPFRRLPSVERAASALPPSAGSRDLAVRAARAAIEEARDAIRAGGGPPTEEQVYGRVAEIARAWETPTLRRAVNATGVLLHTNLGRAVLAPSAARAAADVARGHASLEVDEETGGRGSRQDHVATLLRELTGAEDAFVVNNNAAATFLAIASLATGRDVILSRGQLVEIGGHFRLPDVIASAGATLAEVGTTNRTRLSDYERAVTERTALLLRVHPSNYKIVGFTEEVSVEELVLLGNRAGVPVGDDIGSGALVDLSPYGLRDEPMARASIAAGADVVWFSGDKLLGGPQAGILIGRKSVVDPMKRHPLARALRPDKMTLAALEATLRLYLTGKAWDEVPILRRITRPAENVRVACERVAEILCAHSVLTTDVVETEAEVGGGSLPGHTLPSFAVALTVAGQDAGSVARALRKRATPIYGRVERDRLLLDLRAVDPDEEAEVAQSVREVAG